MLKLSLPAIDIWDEKTEEFKQIGGVTVELEHSLYTVAGWEAKWKKPFADKKGLARKELLDYITNFMCQTPGIPRSAWLAINQDIITQINNYMEDPQTASTVKRSGNGRTTGRREIVTAELLYFYMTQLDIPFECQHWHLNRLLTFIDICAIKSGGSKKMSKKEAAALRASQNARMRAKLGSKG